MRDRERSRRLRLVYDDVIQKGRSVFIISLVRDPIARNVSGFFQNFERHTGVKYTASTFSIEDLIRIFLQNLNHNSAVRWFDANLKPFFGIDVYDYEFPPNGVQVIHHYNTKLLLMRSELPDSVKQSAVRDFLNLPNFLLPTDNVSSEKEYAQTYRKFREAFVAPDWYIRNMYESRFFQHFYDEAQKRRWIQQWTQK